MLTPNIQHLDEKLQLAKEALKTATEKNNYLTLKIQVEENSRLLKKIYKRQKQHSKDGKGNHLAETINFFLKTQESAKEAREHLKMEYELKLERMRAECDAKLKEQELKHEEEMREMKMEVAASKKKHFEADEEEEEETFDKKLFCYNCHSLLTDDLLDDRMCIACNVCKQISILVPLKKGFKWICVYKEDDPVFCCGHCQQVPVSVHEDDIVKCVICSHEGLCTDIAESRALRLVPFDHVHKKTQDKLKELKVLEETNKNLTARVAQLEIQMKEKFALKDIAQKTNELSSNDSYAQVENLAERISTQTNSKLHRKDSIIGESKKPAATSSASPVSEITSAASLQKTTEAKTQDQPQQEFLMMQMMLKQLMCNPTAMSGTSSTSKMEEGMMALMANQLLAMMMAPKSPSTNSSSEK